MTKDKALPPRVFNHGRWYYLVVPEGKKRKWQKVSLIKDGIPTLYRKLAEMHDRDVVPDRLPALAQDWLVEVSTVEHSTKTQVNDAWYVEIISTAFAEFRARDVTAPDVAEFLKRWKDKKRTHNALRSTLQELMRFAEEKGYRSEGTNPVTAIKRMKTPPRKVYVTDSQLRRLKVYASKGNDGKRTRSGPMVCEIINMGYLCGQRASDVLDLRWDRRAATDANGEVKHPYISDEGIFFEPSKTARSTAAKVLIEWTPQLRECVERIRRIGRRHITHVFTTQDSQPYSYWGFNSAWQRAKKRAGLPGVEFRDMRAKALTDKNDAEGIQAAKTMGAHATERQTADYIRSRKAKKTGATR